MDKQKNFYDKVIDHILKKTDIDYDIKQITNWPFYRHGMGFNIFMSAPHSAFGILERHFYFYCKEVYGLTKEESKYVWEGYINMLGETIKLIGGNINESGDKQKEFLDKVLEKLVNETKIDDSRITFPFANFKQPELSSDSLLSVSTWIDGRWENHKYPQRFEKYVNDIYGLTYEESVVLWRRYMGIIEKEILKRLRRNKSNVATTWNMGRHDINESHVDVLPYMDDTEFIKNFTKDLNEKQKGYLNKVVEHLLRETDIDYEKWRINYPFMENFTYSFQYTLPFSGPFIRYCNNIFPLSKDEKRYVHFMYTGIIDSKIRKYYVDNDIYNKYYNVMGTKDIINFDR